MMEICILPSGFCVCKIKDFSCLDLQHPYTFVGITPEEISLVVPEEFAPAKLDACEPGWKGMYIAGELDFSLVGILARLTNLLARQEIPVFAISTYNTDYLFIKKENLTLAGQILQDAGYGIRFLPLATSAVDCPDESESLE